MPGNRHTQLCCLEGSTPEDRGLSLFIALRWIQEPSRGDGVGGRKYPSLLEDFLAGTASMARKRHLASTARGLLCFCLMAQIEVQEVQEVQWVQWVQIRPIRPIRGKKSSGVLPSRQRLGDRCLVRGRCPRLLKVVPSRHQSACRV